MTDRAVILSASELADLTGYRQRVKQLAWLRDRLRIAAPLRADGLPIVSRAQVEAALSGARTSTAAGPQWSKA